MPQKPFIITTGAAMTDYRSSCIIMDELKQKYNTSSETNRNIIFSKGKQISVDLFVDTVKKFS